MGDLQAEHEKLKKDFEELQSEYDKLEENFAEVNEMLDSVAETEKEIEKLDEKNKELSKQVEKLKGENETLKSKNVELLSTSEKQIASYQKEIETLKNDLEKTKARERQLEEDNDQLEQKERIAETSIADLRDKLDEALESTALLQTELDETKTVDDQELQRIKDAYRDAQSELEVKNTQLVALQESFSATPMKGNVSMNDSATGEDGMPITPIVHPGRQLDSPGANESTPPHLSRSLSQSFSPGSTNSPVQLVNDMLGRVKDLEKRLGGCRQSLRRILHT